MSDMSKGKGIGWEVEACPFCASREVEVCRTNENACWLRCDACGCDSESHATLMGAVRNWNARPKATGKAVITSNDNDHYWAMMEKCTR